MDDYDSHNEEPEAELVAVREQKPKRTSGNEGQLTIDVYQTDEDIVIQSTIAGASTDDIDISITSDMVTIKGRREPAEHIKSSDYYYQELYWGPFSRSVILPVDIDADSAKASMKNGILTIHLPKLEAKRTKKIKISQ